MPIIRWRSQSGQISYEEDVAGVKEAFAAISRCEQVLADMVCGLCGGVDLRRVHKVAQGYNFYELHCRKCGGQFQFGQRQDSGELFPRLKDRDGNWMPNNGWFKREPGS